MTNNTFPLNWRQPEDEQEFWLFYGSYMPEPFTPLEMDTILATYITGFDRAFTSLQAGRYRVQFINGYWYVNVNEVPSFTEEEKAAWKQEKFNPLVAQYTAQTGTMEAWVQAWPVEVKQHLAEMDQFDFNQPLPQLLTYLDDTIDRCARISYLHMQHQVTMLMVMYDFEAMYQDLLGQDAPSFHQLLQNNETYALRANRQLWQLSRKIQRYPQIKALFLTVPLTELRAQLGATAEGQPILADLQAYLTEYGKQSEAMFSLRSPSWREEPTPVLLNLKTMLTQPDRDLDAEISQKLQHHEQVIAATRAQIATYPQPVVQQFETLLTQGQKAAYIMDEHTYWMEAALNHHQRQIALAVGRALQARGQITEVNDVFYFHLAELRDLANNNSSQADLVAQRQADLAHYKQLTPPPYLGTFPSGHPPVNPVIDVMSHHAMLQRPVPPTADPQLLSGYAASAGVVTGAVKILRSVSEVAKLQPGDILVTTMTTPVWTSLFMNVVGIITDNGGMLSHAAIVAREMGIPAVVGTGTASKILHDGQVVELNGTTGQVKIL